MLKTFPSPRGFVVVPIHWSLDEAKLSPEWETHERAKYAREEDWQREMELDFGVHLGAPAYPKFKYAIHVFEDAEVPYLDRMPLDLCCDFNQSPMAWTVSQVVAGWENVLDEIFREPSTIEDAVAEFRNLYPTHRGALRIYGDATTRSFYDTMRIALRGYTAPLEMRVPKGNPKVKDRVNAVNTKLAAADGVPGVRIRKRCVNLIQDLQEVMWRPNERDLLKVTDQKDPMYKRTHSSDGWGYKLVREFPLVTQAAQHAARTPTRKPIDFSHIRGDIYYKNKAAKS